MFDLNEAIRQWRDELKRGGVRRRGQLDEMESHLREAIERLAAEGLGPEQAFEQAATALGEPGALGEEFAKTREGQSAVAEALEDGTLALRGNPMVHAASTFLRLLFGICGIIMALSQLYFMIDGYGIRGSGLGWAFMTMGPFVLIYGALGVWGVCTGLKRTAAPGGNRRRMIPGAVILALLLSPVCFVVAIMATYLGLEGIVRVTRSPEPVRSEASPDGRWRAFVVDMPTLDGPDHRLMLEEAGRGKPREIARLMGDTDFNQAIAWSPRGDVVVFTNYYDLFALRLADGKSAVAPLGDHLRQVWRENGTYYIYGQPVKALEVTFPREGGVAYRLEQSSAVKTIPPEAFQSRPDSVTVNPFESGPGGKGRRQ